MYVCACVRVWGGGSALRCQRGCWIPWSCSYSVNCLTRVLGMNTGPPEEQPVLYESNKSAQLFQNQALKISSLPHVTCHKVAHVGPLSVQQEHLLFKGSN